MAGKVFMDWVFIVFALATSLYAFTIVKDHMTKYFASNADGGACGIRGSD